MCWAWSETLKFDQVNIKPNLGVHVVEHDLFHMTGSQTQKLFMVKIFFELLRFLFIHCIKLIFVPYGATAAMYLFALKFQATRSKLKWIIRRMQNSISEIYWDEI